MKDILKNIGLVLMGMFLMFCFGYLSLVCYIALPKPWCFIVSLLRGCVAIAGGYIGSRPFIRR